MWCTVQTYDLASEMNYATESLNKINTIIARMFLFLKVLSETFFIQKRGVEKSLNKTTNSIYERTGISILSWIAATDASKENLLDWTRSHKSTKNVIEAHNSHFRVLVLILLLTWAIWLKTWMTRTFIYETILQNER